MITAEELVRELEGLGAELRVVEGRIKVNAPAGAVSASHRERMRELKEDLLALLRERAELPAQTAVIPIKTGIGAWPIYGVPGHNGDVFCYRALAECLGKDRALFGLQPPGLDGQAGPMSRVEDVAAYFARQIIGGRPRNPVVIAGYCAGGSVAFELARQLRAQGQKVGLLVLIGTPYPTAYRKSRFQFIRARDYVRRIARGRRRFRQLANPAFMLQAFRSLRPEVLASEVNEGLAADQVVLRQALQKATLEAAARYQPIYCGVPILQCLPGREWQRMGVGHDRWEKLTSDYCEFVGPDEITQADMLKLPHARLIASLIEGRIAHLSSTARD